jgi:hypothetical protein
MSVQDIGAILLTALIVLAILCIGGTLIYLILALINVKVSFIGACMVFVLLMLLRAMFK